MSADFLTRVARSLCVFDIYLCTEKAAAPVQAENNFAMSAALVALAVIAALLFAASALKK